ncbi:MAG: hypothetical protein ACK4WH_03910 [Phycisphaerales bacterium]
MMMLGRLLVIWAAVCVPCLLNCSWARAQTETKDSEAALPVGAFSPTDPVNATLSRDRTRVYRLEAGSTYRNACFDPCDCVLDLRSSLSGTMILTRTPATTPGTRRYEVSDVNWRINIGGSDVLVRGSGVYTWYPSLGPLTVLAHRLELDLRIGEGATPVRFDSELIAGASDGEWPPINIVIDMNNQFCTDQVFSIESTPVDPASILTYRLDSGSFYQEGCLPPCLCPILIEQPQGGSFALVPLPSAPDSPAVRQWGVVRIGWFPLVAISPVDAVTTGSGFYFIGPRDARPPVGQRMLVALTRPGTPEEEYDSGLVPLGPVFSAALPPPRITLSIADNGFFCYNQVYGVSAVR